MKSKILYFVILFSLTIFGQTGWEWQNPWPQGNCLNDVFVFDNNKMIAVGSHATILTTNDDGDKWEINYLKEKHIELITIHFIDNKIGWISGIKNKWADSIQSLIFKTMDGGDTWDLLFAFDQIELSNVEFWDENNGWAFGYSFTSNTSMFFKTENGGISWSRTNILNRFSFYYDAQFLNKEIGWICSGDEGGFYKTIDGGISWDSLGSGFSNIHFIDQNNGWAVSSFCWLGCYHEIHKTTDGGLTWDSLYTGFGDIQSIYFLDNLNGWILGAQNFKTTDGGISWDTLSPNHTWWGHTSHWGSPTSYSGITTSMAFNKSGSTGYIVRSTGEILKTIDSGNTWSFSSNLETNLSINSIFFIDPNNGWAAGGEGIFDEEDNYDPFGVILKTNNSGNKWSKVKIPNYFSDQWDSRIAKDIFFTDINHGWIVGDIFERTFGKAIILKTNDGGDNWNAIDLDQYYNFNSVYFINADTGWIAGNTGRNNGDANYKGTIKKTTDSGNNWQTFTIDNDFTTINDIYFADSKNGWAVGEKGILLNTSDGGDNWSFLKLVEESVSLSSVFFYDSFNGWITGYKQHTPSFEVIMLRTKDEGASWTSHFIKEDWVYKINSLWFKDSLNGLAVASSLHDDEPGTLLFTHDGGESWESETSMNSQGLNTIFFSDENNGWIGGAGGAILKTSTGGLTTIEGSVTKLRDLSNSYSLAQNYPNPFNPSTTIKYSIPSVMLNSFQHLKDGEIPKQVRDDNVNGLMSVRLNVFDILGREVATLVNEKQKPGNYEVIWNADNVPSGVYFYQLKAGDFIQTKKMLMIK